MTCRGRQKIVYVCPAPAQVVLELPAGSASGVGLRKLTLMSCGSAPPQVFTVDEMMPHLQEVSGAVTKNLFLKDKKKKGLWLVSARHDRQVGSHPPSRQYVVHLTSGHPIILSVPLQVNLNDLAKKLGVGSGNLRFADEAAMLEKLKVRSGP